MHSLPGEVHARMHTRVCVQRLGGWQRFGFRRCGPGQLEERPQASRALPQAVKQTVATPAPPCGRQASCFARLGPPAVSVSGGSQRAMAPRDRGHSRFLRCRLAGGPPLLARPTGLRPHPAMSAARPRGSSRLCFAVYLPHAGLHHLHQKERHGGRLGVRGRSLHHEAHFPLGAARRVPHPEF